MFRLRVLPIVSVVAMLVLLVVMPALASAQSDTPPRPQTVLPSVRVADAVPARLTCGLIDFPRAALDNPRGYERRRTPVAAALRAFLRSGELATRKSGWYLLARTAKVAQVAVGGPSSLGVMTFQRRAGRWRYASDGSCTPRAVWKGIEAAPWRLEPMPAPPPPEARQISVLLDPPDCASGEDATGRVERPHVHYSPDAVTVRFFVRPPRGWQTCPGSPPTRGLLTLDEPLGGRRLQDGGAVTPRAVTSHNDDGE